VDAVAVLTVVVVPTAAAAEAVSVVDAVARPVAATVVADRVARATTARPPPAALMAPSLEAASVVGSKLTAISISLALLCLP